jgi:hypothetical protein
MLDLKTSQFQLPHARNVGDTLEDYISFNEQLHTFPE